MDRNLISKNTSLRFTCLALVVGLLVACSRFKTAQPVGSPPPATTRTSASASPSATPEGAYPGPRLDQASEAELAVTLAAVAALTAYPGPAIGEPSPAGTGSEALQSTEEGNAYPAPPTAQRPGRTPVSPTSAGQEPYPGPGGGPPAGSPTAAQAGPPVPPTQPDAAGTLYPAPEGVLPTATLVPTASPLSTPLGGLRPPATPPVLSGTPVRFAPVTISLWHSWSVAERQILDEVLQSYQEIFPDVRFDVLYVPFDELLGKYETAAASGEGPDVVLAPGDWGARFYDESLVADLTGLASPDFLATISPAALQAVRYRGAMIGLPYRMDGIVMYRNTSIVGFTPQDFESLISLSRSATKAGVVGAYLERSFFYAAAHLYGAGGRLMDDNGSPAFNNAGGIEWLGLLKSFERAGLTEFNGNRDLELFKQGKAGIIFEGSWNRNVLADAIGARNLAIDPWPAAGSGHLSGFIRTENLYLNANVRGDENLAALQFMGFFLAPQVQAILTLAGHIPAVIGVETSDPLLQQSVLAFTAATAFPILPQAASYWDPLEEAMLSVFNEGVDPALALRHAHDRILARLP